MLWNGSLLLSVLFGVSLVNTWKPTAKEEQKYWQNQQFHAVIRAAPQNGDIRLADGSEIRGRLEMFNSSTGKWGTVCYDHQLDERGAARAACRQLGYEDVTNVDTVAVFSLPVAPASTPIVLYNLNCPYNTVSDLNNEIEHILRCKLSFTGSCTHSQDMAIQCKNTSKYNNPYTLEVRLAQGGTGFPSSGVLELYNNNAWGTVCAGNMTLVEADTACRQMGYTGSSGYSSVSPDVIPELQPAVKNLSCSIPYPCIGQCTGQLDPFFCDFGQIATINCTFDLAFKEFTPGSESLCGVANNSGGNFAQLAEIIGGAVGGIVLVIIVIIILLCCCCFISGCPLHTCREKQMYGYDQIQ